MENQENSQKKSQEIEKIIITSEKRWRTQDWVWLVCFLLYAQIFTVFYKEMVMTVVSFVSTFVSTALGAVAIYISVREATKGDEVKDQINLILGELREKVNQMDTKLNNFDPREFNKEKDLKIDEIKNNIKSELEKGLSEAKTMSKEDIMLIVNDKVEEATNDLKTSLTIRNDKDRMQQAYRDYLNNVIRVRNVIKSLPPGTKIGTSKIYNAFQGLYNIDVSIDMINEQVKKSLEEGIIIQREDGLYVRSNE
ncbi:hypothetical protein ACP26L_25670 [Paenibacillus sp. S-38]|uniref:hypothetical protein n=1 Tax=Paenibacillus sp. S-38 TaxID=3416710 RepID=UPI003CF1097B